MPEHEHNESDEGPVIVRFTDGKAGHENQTLGLLGALEARLGGIESHEINIASMSTSFLGRTSFYANPPDGFPRADVWLGAGHATHPHLKAAARFIGGHTVVCMNPGSRWARRSFDLCLIPEHDGVPGAANIVHTKGALNAIAPSEEHDPSSGLILIGGPSKHHGWDAESISGQVDSIVSEIRDVRWELTTSRRTPPETLDQLASLGAPNLAITPVDRTHKGWVGEKLASAGQCWISEDSVSMVYESLTSGARTGVLRVPRKRDGRVSRGIDELVRGARLSRAGVGSHDLRDHPLDAPLWEADRCAGIIVERFLGWAVDDG
ncbi:MAG: mitochondrial fission ELM1 family protein [Planctomycetota bacterium]|jgi:mitochondrial fission protein ELM1